VAVDLSRVYFCDPRDEIKIKGDSVWACWMLNIPHLLVYYGRQGVQLSLARPKGPHTSLMALCRDNVSAQDVNDRAMLIHHSTSSSSRYT
jgi:hypothetical protein